MMVNRYSKSPFVSIVLTVFNGSKYLRAQLDSIVKQDYKNFELIIVDDCSVDGSQEILSEYLAKDKRISVYVNERNIGPIQTFEVGIMKANGELICLSDQDDIWLPCHLQTLIAGIGENSLVHSDAFLMYDEEKTEKLFSNHFRWVYNLSDGEKLKYLLQSNYIRGANCMFTQELKSIVLPFPKDIVMHDHWIAFCAHLNGGIKDLNNVTCYYRRHKNTVTSESRIDFHKFLNWNPIKFSRSIWRALEKNHPIKQVLTGELYSVLFRMSNKNWYPISFVIKNYDTIFGPRRKLHKPLIFLRLVLLIVLRRTGRIRY